MHNLADPYGNSPTGFYSVSWGVYRQYMWTVEQRDQVHKLNEYFHSPDQYTARWATRLIWNQLFVGLLRV